MNFQVEAIIDIDTRRRAVLAGNVEDVDADQFPMVAHALTREVVTQALTAAAVASGEDVEEDGAAIAAAAGAEPLAPSQRPKRPDDPATMRAFGEED